MKQKEEKRAKVLMATAAAFIVVLAFSGIVSADPYCGGLPLTNVKEGEVSGDLWFEHYSPLTHSHAEESFTLPSYTDVEWAQLYVAVYCGHMQKNYAGRANITFNGFQLGGTADGLSSEAFDVCYTYPGKEYTTACTRGSAGYNGEPGPGTGPEWVNEHCVRVTSDYLMWYNVTDLVQPNSNVVVDTWNMEGYTGTFDNRTKVITLVVAYNDGDSDNVRYWVNQGHDVDNYYWDDQGGPNYIGETSFAADLPTGSTIQKSNLTVVQMASDDGTYTYNTGSIPTDPDGTTTPPGENWQDDYSGYNIWYASSQFNSNSDNTLNYDRIGGFYKIFLGLLTAECTGESTDSPDLIPTAIKVTHNYYNGAWAMLNNAVYVSVENIDGGDAGAFDVKLYAKLNGNFEEVGSETVSSLSSGNSTEASFVWKPSEVGDYSLKTVVDSDNSIAESNETNNELIKLQSAGHNGYVGDKPLTTYAHGKIKGNISFTHGDSFYSGKLNNGDTYTVHHTVNIPDGATLKFARLYNYWTWCPDYPVMDLTFDGNTISPDQEYTDRKGWGSYYDYPTGTYGYNVTSFVTGSGSHTTVVTNTGTDYFCMDGIGLLLVYTDTNGKDIEYWINEGADMLSTMDTSGGLMPEEATAQALFSGAIDLDTVSGAWLWTIVQSGGCTGNMLMFNDCDWPGVYDGTPYSDLDIDERRDVSGCLNTNDHLVQIRAADYPPDGDYLVPSNAFLVVEYTEEVIYNVSIMAEPDEQTTTPNANATYTLTITNTGNVADTITVTITGNEADAAILSEDTLILTASESATVSLNVKDADAGTYNTMVRATSQGNTNVFDDMTVKTTVVTAGLPTADYLELQNASGMTGTYVEVPVNIANVRNGPVQGIRLTVDYAESVLSLTSVSSGDLLTSNWTSNLGIDGHTVILATKYTNEAIPDGSSGSVVLLNFSVLGSPGDTSPMNLPAIELSNPDGEVGTAPAKNGTFTVPELLPPTADYLELPNASGMTGTYVEVPVNIINVQNGPIQGIRLDVDYDESVLDMTSISSGDLTSEWTHLELGKAGHTVILATDITNDAIPDGSSGSIVLLNFSVIGSPGDTSPMNLSAIELSNPDGVVGTASAKNGTFTVPERGSIEGRITYICNETGIAGVNISLTLPGTVPNTTLTNETGYYLFTDVSPDDYVVSATKPRFWDNATDVTVTAGEVTTADMVLRLKGDLNDDGVAADAGDVMLMLRASTRDISGDYQYDLNGNGVIADAGDVVLILRASVGDIILW